MNKLQELQTALTKFCNNQYANGPQPMTAKNFTLYAVDGGGYDVTNEVTLHIEDSEFTLSIDDQLFFLELKQGN